MTSYKKWLWGAPILFFAGGLWWGLQERTPTSTLSVVCSEDLLPKDILESVAKRLDVKLNWINYSNWSELSRILANEQGHFDLLCTHSFLSKDLIESNWMDKFDFTQLGGTKNLASDFKQMPFDPKGEYFVPLGWAINAFLVEKSTDNLSWEELWPNKASQMVLNYPDLELYWRMRQEGLEIDPEKQGRYNTDSEGFVKKFMSQLGGIKHPNEKISLGANSSKIIQISNKTWSSQPYDTKERFKISELKDGVSVWFLLMGVGKHSLQKDISHKVLSELLTPNISNSLRNQRGFAHVLAQFDDSKDVPLEMKASFLRAFPLQSLRFPDLSLEGLPQWETMMKSETKADVKDQNQSTGSR